MDNNDEIEGGVPAQSLRDFKTYKKCECNARLEELAKPKKWYMLSTWKEFHNIFEPERMQALKDKVQEEFSMTPEETELYFLHLRKQIRKIRDKKALEKQRRQDRALAKQEAYRIFGRVLKKAMTNAFKKPPPVIVSTAVRKVSENILQQLCNIHCISVPGRDCADRDEQFFLSLADWAAIIISDVYYEVNVNDKVDTERPTHLNRCPSASASTLDKRIDEKESGEWEDEKEERISPKHSEIVDELFDLYE